MVLVVGHNTHLSLIPTTAGHQPLLKLTFPAHTLPVFQKSIFRSPSSTMRRHKSCLRSAGRRPNVAAFYFAGQHTSTYNRPRTQVPLDKAKHLESPRDVLHLESSFRDGQVYATHKATPVMKTCARNVLAYLSLGLKTKKRVYFRKTIPCPVCNGRGAPAEETVPPYKMRRNAK
ncbi:unnamed protein product [Hapterophycus canaliculatus]